MNIPALVGQGQALLDAETVLFVDDGEAQVGKGDPLLEQRMGSDNDGQRAGNQRRQRASTGPRPAPARQQADLNPGGRQKR